VVVIEIDDSTLRHDAAPLGTNKRPGVKKFDGGYPFQCAKRSLGLTDALRQNVRLHDKQGLD
jgi:hypothetical protein